MKKTIIFLLLIFFAINLKAVEEIQLQWEDITPPAGFTPRYLQMDDNDNMYGLLGNRIFFYEYTTNNWTTQNLPVGVDINKVIDFDVDENGKAYFVIEGSSQFLIYNLNTKEISYLDLPKVEGYKYWYTYKIKNNKLFYFVVDLENEDSYRLSYADVKENSVNLINYNSLLFQFFRYDKFSNKMLANSQFIFELDNANSYKIDYNSLNGNNFYKKLLNFDDTKNLYLNNASGNENNVIILYKTSDYGNNWELVSQPELYCEDICQIFTELVFKNNIVFIGESEIENTFDKRLTLTISIDGGTKWKISKVHEFGNFGTLKLFQKWWGTENLYVPIDQNLYITKNNELIVYSQERMLKTDLKKITSVENETKPPLKNLSVLYGNISDNILNINIESGINSNAKISLYSSDLREIEQFSNVEFLQGKNELTFNINTTLSTGAYYVFIESGNYKHFYRIIKN